MPRPTEQHRDAPLDAGAKALAVLELPALLIGFALGALLPPSLWNAHDFDACCLHDVTFFSLKKPRSDPYNLGTWPKFACGVPAKQPLAVRRPDFRPTLHTV